MTHLFLVLTDPELMLLGAFIKQFEDFAVDSPEHKELFAKLNEAWGNADHVTTDNLNTREIALRGWPISGEAARLLNDTLWQTEQKYTVLRSLLDVAALRAGDLKALLLDYTQPGKGAINGQTSAQADTNPE